MGPSLPVRYYLQLMKTTIGNKTCQTTYVHHAIMKQFQNNYVCHCQQGMIRTISYGNVPMISSNPSPMTRCRQRIIRRQYVDRGAYLLPHAICAASPQGLRDPHVSLSDGDGGDDLLPDLVLALVPREVQLAETSVSRRLRGWEEQVRTMR